ncbi:MAG: endopeptidase La [Deltaproteobacteria bacterium]|nr:endopeptidase La [Deltaproteobacteria bacterium]
MQESPTRIVPVLPVRNAVLFPLLPMPLNVGREKSLQAIQEATSTDSMILILTQRAPQVDDPREDDLYRVGTLAKIIKVESKLDGGQNTIVQGLSRFRIRRFVQYAPCLKVEGETLEDRADPSRAAEVDALLRNVKTLAQKIVKLSPNIPAEASLFLGNLENPGNLADIVAAYLNIPVERKQDVLETMDVRDRLQEISRHLTKELEILELSHKIQSEVKGNIDKSQREYYRREQMKAIQKELGEREPGSEVDELREAIAKAKMPEQVEKVAFKELDRLERMNSSSPEYSVARTYLDWLIELPWAKETDDRLDLEQAEKILNEDHYDLEKVKKRILEYLAVRKLKKDMKGPILCFAGPPGVGKTSLGKSIARALGREFVRISLGGIRDEAEIRGHRRTYVGALPGRIIQGMKKASTSNPVFMLDEIDKVGTDFRGDPSSALLEVLDPEQNDSFSDHYLDVPFDLSKVMFITTANILDTIPAPLRDRMEVLSIPGYTEYEKLFIGTKYLVPEQIDEHGLTAEQIEIPDAAIRKVIRSYTKEAGVRNLKREIASVCRSVAKEVALGRTDKRVLDENEVTRILGPIKFFQDVAERTAVPGVATGLAWTPVGGDLLFIEATRMKGKGKVHLTGQLGEVMKESAYAALSFIRSNAARLGIDDEIFERTDFHIHVPAGSIPKDGPSAGVTILTAITSLLVDRPIDHETAMTGEITLRGAVLPIGGIKEKVLAAHRAGIRRVIIPEKNEKDLEDVPDELKKELRFYFVDRMEQVLDLAILKEPGTPGLQAGIPPRAEPPPPPGLPVSALA